MCVIREKAKEKDEEEEEEKKERNGGKTKGKKHIENTVNVERRYCNEVELRVMHNTFVYWTLCRPLFLSSGYWKTKFMLH